MVSYVRINDEPCPREGELVRDKSLPQLVKVHWRGLAQST